jgi:predicted TIM-barrel enzyme/DNA-binding NtrC family response regulator
MRRTSEDRANGSPPAADFKEADPLARLRASLRTPNAILVGAAIGTGMAAQAAARGGADLLLALNAGRLRSMGAPSITSLLALRDSNALVMEFSSAEILPMAQVPVFFGACVFDPRKSVEEIVDTIAAARFGGVVNFPTSVFLDGAFRSALEEAGIGFSRELALLEAAQRRGLMTLGYVHTVEEAEQMARSRIDIINLNLGWNTGGSKSVRTRLGLEEAAEYAKMVFRAVRKHHPSAVCMLEGGPIVSPEEMYQVCKVARAEGYIGGSTIDRLPPEASIESMTWAFKAVGTLQRRIDQLERRITRVQRDHGLVGASARMRRVQKLVDQLATGDSPVVIVGEEGTGKELVARALHSAGRKRVGRFFVVDCATANAEADLFGVSQGALGSAKHRIGYLESGSDATIFLDDIGALNLKAQERLLKAMETGIFRRLGGDQAIRIESRLVFACPRPMTTLVKEERLDPRLRTFLKAAQVMVPPLRERLEDLPLLANHFLKRFRGENAAGRAASLEHSAYRILMAYSWPGNVREFRAVIEQAALSCGNALITASDLPPLGGDEMLPVPASNERDWILEGLRRNRFRRDATARFLGISRKTLYNKMKALGLPVDHRRDTAPS